MSYRFLIVILIIFAPIAMANKEESKSSKKVEAITIKKGRMLRTARLLGRVEAKRQAFIKSEAAGMVAEIHVKPGQTVNKGDLLLSIENQREKDRLEYATKSKELAQNQVNRLQKLSDSGRSSLKELEEAKRMVLEADRQQSAAEDDLAHREIRAPFDGEVGIFNFTEGGSVSIGDKITSIADLSEIFVVFDVSESISELIKIDGLVEIEANKGKIIAIDPIINPDTGMTKVKSKIEIKGKKPGQSIYVEVILEQRDDIIAIPEEAIFMSKGITTVVIVKDDLVEYQPVQLGLKQRNQIEITDGLKEGDVIVSVNPRRIYPNDKVEVVSK